MALVTYGAHIEAGRSLIPDHYRLPQVKTIRTALQGSHLYFSPLLFWVSKEYIIFAVDLIETPKAYSQNTCSYLFPLLLSSLSLPLSAPMSQKKNPEPALAVRPKDSTAILFQFVLHLWYLCFQTASSLYPEMRCHTAVISCLMLIDDITAILCL